jgi:hypothetical protein
MASYAVNFLMNEKTGIAAVTTSALYMPKSGESGTAVQKAAQGRIKSHIARFLGLSFPAFTVFFLTEKQRSRNCRAEKSPVTRYLC